MKDIGKMILNLVKELKFGQKEVNMLDNTKMERNKDMEPTHGLTDLFTKETGLTIASMVLVNTNGKTEESIMETGTIMTCTVWEYISTPME